MDSEQTVPILSRLSPAPGSVRARKRVGRGPGSGLGKTCGRGVKGQKSRSGNRKPARGFEGGQMPLLRRLPKFGFRNPFPKQVATVNVGALGGLEAGTILGPEELAARRLVRGRYEFVKILGGGELDNALVVKAHAFSASARAKIEGAGGKVELLAPQSSSKKELEPGG
ncbi:MAG: 50S ribosomal protein L15 [Proteobacteria bacterium]|nr:50S ribosomal protein L15 [Pseudomonadota bacterium]